MNGIRCLVLLSTFFTSHVLAQNIVSISPAEIAAMLERQLSVRVIPGEVIIKYKSGLNPLFLGYFLKDYGSLFSHWPDIWTLTIWLMQGWLFEDKGVSLPDYRVFQIPAGLYRKDQRGMSVSAYH